MSSKRQTNKIAVSETSLKDPAAIKTKPAKARRSFGKTFLVVLFVLLALIVLALGIIWLNRYNFAETYAKNVFREQGIEAELSIETMTRDGVVIKNASLTYQNETAPFFTVKRLEADYILKEAMEGRMKRLRFVEPKANLTLDEKFQIIDGWMPPSSQKGGQGFTIPMQGIFIEDGDFKVTTPYGSPEMALTAEIFETDQFAGELIFQPTEFNYEAWQGMGSARLNLSVTGHQKTVDALMQLDRLSGQSLAVLDATLSAKGIVDVDTTLPIDVASLDMQFDGEVNGRAKTVDTSVFKLSQSKFDWDGGFTRKTGERFPLRFAGDLDLATDKFQLSTKQRAREVAELLSLSEAFSKTPIAQHFSPSLTRAVEGFLNEASVDAKVRTEFDGERAVVAFSEPLTVKNKSNTLTVKTTDTKDAPPKPVYEWSADDERLSLSFDAEMNKPVPLSLSHVVMNAASPNGVELKGVLAFNGRAKTGQDWRVISEGEPGRLGPFLAVIDYAVSTQERVLNVETKIDYDGRLPVGVVEGLKTQGKATVVLAPPGQTGLSLSYKPSQPLMTVTKLTNETDWVFSDVALSLPDSRKAFVSRGETAEVAAGLMDVSLKVGHKTDGRQMTIQAGAVTARGDLSFADSRQVWDLELKEAVMLSDTVPMTGTRAYIPEGQLQVDYASPSLNFDFKTPSLNVELPTGRAQGVSLSAKGTPETFSVSHSDGVFETDRADIPKWPVSGEISYDNEAFKGEARIRLPKTDNVEAVVAYEYGDEAGRAEITLESLVFKPGRLQPQDFFPALTGKITSVDGAVSADLFVEYAKGDIQNSGGVVRLVDMNFSTAPGPVKTLNSDIALNSLFPPQTTGVQSLTLEEFNPGIPLRNGAVKYELLSDNIRISEARWPLGEGAFTLDPFSWQYGALENRVIMRMQQIPVDTLLKTVGNEKIQATGTVYGEFPIVVQGIKVTVDKGFIEAKDGGIIRYSPDEGTAVTYSQEEALDIIRRQDTAQYRSLARDALREFKYRELRLSIDGPLDGDVELGVIFDGTNEKVLNGQPFEFDIDVQGELFNILRSFNSNAQIKSEILRQSRENAGTR
jgi:hypothetical protein